MQETLTKKFGFVHLKCNIFCTNCVEVKIKHTKIPDKHNKLTKFNKKHCNIGECQEASKH